MIRLNYILIDGYTNKLFAGYTYILLYGFVRENIFSSGN